MQFGNMPKLSSYSACSFSGGWTTTSLSNFAECGAIPPINLNPH